MACGAFRPRGVLNGATALAGWPWRPCGAEKGVLRERPALTVGPREQMTDDQLQAHEKRRISGRGPMRNQLVQLTREERLATIRALGRCDREYVDSDVPVCILRERQLIAAAEREAARGARDARIREVEAWGRYRAGVRARLLK
jgi:hypothetical protein